MVDGPGNDYGADKTDVLLFFLHVECVQTIQAQLGLELPGANNGEAFKSLESQTWILGIDASQT